MGHLRLLVLCTLCAQALSQGAEENAFCAALQTVLDSHCSLNSCTTSGASYNCILVDGARVFEFQSTIELCTEPPRYELVVRSGRSVVVDETVSESSVITTPLFNIDITLNVSSNGFGVGIEAHGGDITTVLLNYRVFPYDLSLCPVNISGSDFRCPALNNQEPAHTVHELKPSDVKVIGAIGNSLTAGLLILNTLIDYKGLAFTGGGFTSLDFVTTLPNILKKYSPDLIGFSVEQSNPLEESLNVGVSGATTRDVLNETILLVERIRNTPGIDFDNDWKLVTVFIGNNDVCDFSCLTGSLNLVQEWVDNIDQSLVYLRDNLPRTFVNLMQMTRITAALDYVEAFPPCQPFAASICPCIFANASAVAMTDVVVERFQEQLSALVDSRKYDVSNEFTVIVQPFLANSRPLQDENGNTVISNAAIDCVHLSPSGNRLYATALWNNMLQDVGAKDTAILRDGPIMCPSQESPYFSTYLNTANCPPLCTHKFCSAKETRRADCTIPGEVSGCDGGCAVTSCRACYYSDSVRPTPDTDISCQAFSSRQKCFGQWATQVRRANARIHGKPSRRQRSQQFFKCYAMPCTL